VTRAEQIRKALKVLAPSGDGRDGCRGSIENALDIMADAATAGRVFAAMRSKAVHKAERTYCLALRRLRVAHKALLAAGGGVPIGIELTDIERMIKSTEPRRYEPVYRAGGSGQVFAVALAHSLLREWRQDIRIVTTRGKEWHRLSAILFGNETADLFRYLCSFSPDTSPFGPTPGSK
jgi:hypothetical protein